MAGDFFRPPTFVDVLQTFIKPKSLKRLALAIGLVVGLYKLVVFVARNPARLLATCVFLGSTLAWGWRWGIVLAALAANLWGYYRFQNFLTRSDLIGWRQIIVACWRVFRLKRKMPTELAKVGLALKKHEPATAMTLGEWRGTQRGITVRAYSGSIGLAERKVFDKVDDLRAALYVDRLRAKVISSGTVDLHLEYGQHLRRIIGLEDVPPASHPDKVSFGITELGGPLELFWWLSILLGGVTGSGKSGGIWALLAGLLAQGIPFTVRIVDQDGVEFQVFRMAQDSPIVRVYEDNLERLGLTGQPRGRGRAARAADDDARDEVGAFWTAITRDLQRRMRLIPPGQRFWNITPGADPMNGLDITIVDELLPFQGLLKGDPIQHASGQLNVRGRKPRMVGWYATQSALAEVLGPWRDLVAQRVAYRTTSSHMTDTILGPGSTALGAKAHELEPGIDNGVCYLRDVGGGFISGRSAWIPDEDMVTIANGQLPPVRDLGSAATIEPRWVYHLHAGPGADTPLPEETGVCGHPGRLLYIGSSNDVQRRVAEHRRDHNHREPWGQFIDPSRTTAEVWPDQTSGLTEEYIQIHRWEDHLPYNESGTRRQRRTGPGEEAPF
jgi:hypothetical protein